MLELELGRVGLPSSITYFQRFTLPQMRWRRGENAGSGWISLTTDTQPKEIFALMSDTAPGDRK